MSTASYNTFQLQALQYLGLTGGSAASFQTVITTTAYTPTISNQTTITVNGATGYQDSLLMTWGTIDATLANGVATGSFTFTFPPTLYGQVPAVVFSVSGNDDDSYVYVSGVDTDVGDCTIAVKRDTTTDAANLKICWISQPQP